MKLMSPSVQVLFFSSVQKSYESPVRCAARECASGARTYRWRGRSGRWNSCFLFLPFRPPRFLLRLLRFSQWPKLHNFCLHRAIRHFVIRTPHFLVGNHVFHRRWLTAFSDDSFIGNLERMRSLFSGDGERLCFVIHCGDHAFEWSSSYLAARRCCRCTGCIRICGTARVRWWKRFFRRSPGMKREANDKSREKRGDNYEILVFHVSMKLSTYNVDPACRCILSNGVWRVWQGENAQGVRFEKHLTLIRWWSLLAV